VAKSVIESVRGLHPVYVFVRAHKKEGGPAPVTKINNTAWKAARERAANGWAEAHSEAAKRHRRGFEKFESTISSTLSAADFAQRECRSRIVRICSGSAAVDRVTQKSRNHGSIDG